MQKQGFHNKANRIWPLLLSGLLTVALCNGAIAGGQGSDKDKKPKKSKDWDTAYVSTYPNTIGVHPLFNYKFNTVLLRNNEAGVKAVFQPNSNFKLGGGFFVDWFGFALTFQIPVSDQRKYEKGPTKSFDTQINLYSKQFTLDLFQQNYKGYYLRNYQDLLPGWDDKHDYYPHREDLRTTNLGGNFAYIFNYRKYTQRGVYMLNVKQKKTAGSFLLGGAVVYNRFMGDSAIIQPSLSDSLGIKTKIDKIQTLSFSVTGGYAVTFAFLRNFFINLSGQVGPMYSLSKATSEVTKHVSRLDKMGFKWNLRGAIGYNGPKWYGGVVALIDQYSMFYNEYTYSFNLGSIRLFVGYRLRFNAKIKLFGKNLFY